MPAPTAERLKVRCYRCNQLLAVAPSKAGTVVACPKCKAELLIPRPAPQPADGPSDPSVLPLKSGTFAALAPVTDAPTRSASPAGPSSFTFPDEIAALIPPEVAALRPEDLRVEAEVFEAIAREPRPAPASALAPALDPFVFPSLISTGNPTARAPADEPEPTMPPEVSAFFTSAGAALAGPALIDTPPPLPQPALVPAPAPEPAVVPPISIELERIRPSAEADPRAIREVVLPASVVLAWSLFVLLAIPMAFVAGLMIGHFLWRTGP